MPAAFFTTGQGKSSDSSYSGATGRISFSANSCAHFRTVRWSSESWKSIRPPGKMSGSPRGGDQPIAYLSVGYHRVGYLVNGPGNHQAEDASPGAAGAAPPGGPEGVRPARLPHGDHGRRGERGGDHQADPVRPFPVQAGPVPGAPGGRPGHPPEEDRGRSGVLAGQP